MMGAVEFGPLDDFDKLRTCFQKSLLGSHDKAVPSLYTYTSLALGLPSPAPGYEAILILC